MCLKGTGGLISTLESVTLSTSISGVEYSLDFLVVPSGDLPSPILIGDPLLDIADIRITKNDPVLEPIVDEAYVQYEQLERKYDPIEDLVSTFPEDYRERIRSIIENYTPFKSANYPVQMCIELKDKKPVVNRPRRLSPREREAARQLLGDREDRCIVRQGTSEYASAKVIVTKKDGSIRICIDYKRLNKIESRLHFSMPLIEDVLDATERSIYSTCLDLKDRFFHVDVAESS